MTAIHIAMIACEDHQGVFLQAILFQGIQQAADLGVDPLGKPAIDPAVIAPVAFVVILADQLGRRDGGHLHGCLDGVWFPFRDRAVLRQRRQLVCWQSLGFLVKFVYQRHAPALGLPGVIGKTNVVRIDE